MATLLISRTCQPEAAQLAVIARSCGWHHQWLRKQKTPSHLNGNSFAIYAETDIALRVSRQYNLRLIEPALNLLTRLPHEYTLRSIRSMALNDAMAIPNRAFFKPADCTNKCFDSAVCEAGKFLFCGDHVPRNTSVLVADEVSWEVEYRVIVLERKVITFSPYIRGGWLARDENDRWSFPEKEAAEMLSFCELLLSDQRVSLPPVFTLDVGIIKGRGWAVVEFNPVWCSGLLGCDLNKMLPVFARACQREEQLSDADRDWVIQRSIH